MIFRRFTFLQMIWILALGTAISCNSNDEIPESNSSLGFIIKSGTEITESSVILKNGNTVLVGSINQDGFVLAIDAKGKELWYQVIGGNLDDAFYSVLELADGSILVGGKTSSPSKGVKTVNSDAYLVHLSAQGTILWERNYGGDLPDIIFGLTEHSDGSIIAVGSYSALSLNSWVLKLDADGNEIWSKTFNLGPTSPWHDIAKSVLINKNNEIVVCGICSPNTFNLTAPNYLNYTININLGTGVSNWVNYYLDYARNWFFNPIQLKNKIHETSEGYILISADNTSGSKSKVSLLILDENGNPINNTNYEVDGSRLHMSNSKIDSHNAILFFGKTFASNSGGSKALTLKFNSEGDIIWNSSFSLANIEHTALNGRWNMDRWEIIVSRRDILTGKSGWVYYSLNESGNIIYE